MIVIILSSNYGLICIYIAHEHGVHVQCICNISVIYKCMSKNWLCDIHLRTYENAREKNISGFI